MKRKLLKSTCIMLAASMALAFTGCEKKAVNVEELGAESGTDTATPDASETGTENAQTTNSLDTFYEAANGNETLYEWRETIDGGSNGFETVDVDISIYDYSDTAFDICTFEAEPFDEDYIKNICDALFDDGEVEVYDYHHKTKKVYEDLIGYYETANDIYTYCKDNNMEVFSYYPGAISPTWGEWELLPATEEFDGSVIEHDIDTLKAEMEEAPESIANDYSYQGYLGKVNGEEYYMYFGNRNYDEYLSSPETTQYNGRAITIMKENLEEAFNGSTIDYDELMGEYTEVPSSLIEDDSPFNKKQAIVIDASLGTTTIHNINEDDTEDEAEVNSDYIAQAEEFISKLGFGDYEFTGASQDLYWGTGVSSGFLYTNQYTMMNCDMLVPDGKIISFGLKPHLPTILNVELDYTNYLEDSNPFYYSSYIDVMINDKGIVGCQIINPVKITQINTVSNIIDNESAAEIVKESVSDKSKWNIPTGSKAKLFDINEARLISFPIRSESSDNEYTLIPCYAFFRQSGDSRLESSPFLLINGLDGSIVKVEDNLSDPPSGWDNGNVGYDLFYNAGWMRFETIESRKSLEEDD